MIQIEQVNNLRTNKGTQRQSSKKHSKQKPLHRITTKNISSKVKNGTILQTRDEFFEGQGNYRKPGYENKGGNYRKAVVIDSNRKNELAVVKLTTSKNAEILVGESKFKPFIEIKDDNNNFITTSSKFVKTRKFLSKKLVNYIKIKSLKQAGSRNKINRNKLRELKGRQKK